MTHINTKTSITGQLDITEMTFCKCENELKRGEKRDRAERGGVVLKKRKKKGKPEG